MAVFIIFGSAIVGLVPGVLVCLWLGIYGEASAVITGLGWIPTFMGGWKLAEMVDRPPASEPGSTWHSKDLGRPNPSPSSSEQPQIASRGAEDALWPADEIADQQEQRPIPEGADSAFTANELDRPAQSSPEELGVARRLTQLLHRRADESGDEPTKPELIAEWMLLNVDPQRNQIELLELGHDAWDVDMVSSRLNLYRFQGCEGLVYATEEGLEVTWGEKGPTYGLLPRDVDIFIDEAGLLTRKRKSGL